MEVIPEFSGVGQRLDHAVHEAGVAEVDQSCEAGQTHFLLLLFLVALIAGRGCVGHGLHHAGGLRLRQETHMLNKKSGKFLSFSPLLDSSTLHVEFPVITILTHRGNAGLWFGDSYVFWDRARSHGIQTSILHSGRGLGGFGFLLPDSRRLLLGREVVLAAAWLALLHAGRAGGHGDFGATHCTLNRGG